MRKLLLIATLSIFTALSLTGCSEQDVDKAVQKVGEVIEDNKISQEQLDSAEDKFNTVKDKTSEIVEEAKDAIMEEVEKATEEAEEATEEETTVEGDDSSADAGNAGHVGFDVDKATRVSASDVGGEGNVGGGVEIVVTSNPNLKASNDGDENHDITFASGNEASNAGSEVAEPKVLATTKEDFNKRNLFYKTNCIEDVETYANIVVESRGDQPDGHIGLDIRKMVANDAYLKALKVLSKIDFEDISVSSKLVNKYNEGEEEFTKALVEILSAM